MPNTFFLRSATARSLSPLLLLLGRHSSSSSSSTLTEETIIATLYSYSSDWRRALDFFDYSSSSSNFPHSSATFTAAIDILGKHLEFALCFSLLRRMSTSPSTSPTRSTFQTLFNRLAAARLVADAVEILGRSSDYNLLDSSTFLSLLDALCDHRLAAEAADLLARRSAEYDFPFSGADETKARNILLKGWLNLRAFKECRHLWDDMEHHGIRKDLHSYSIYLSVLSKSGKPYRAIKLYKQMKSSGIKLDTVAFNTVICAAGLIDGPERAIRVYREMIEDGCKPSVSTFNTIIKLFCDEGRISEARVYMDKMKHMGCPPDAVTYHCFFRNMNRPQEILELFDGMVEGGCHPRMDTYTMLIKKFGRWGFLRPVFVVWNAMQEHRCSPDAFAYNALIDALVQKGMVELARKYDVEMVEKGLAAKPRRELGTKGPGVDPEDNVSSDMF